MHAWQTLDLQGPRGHLLPMQGGRNEMTIWSAIAASVLVFGQMGNFGTGPDPEEKKRAEKMIAQNQKVISQNWLVIGIAIIALIISLIALFRTH
jgi:hypothetical protein